jgi:hypothetical protein
VATIGTTARGSGLEDGDAELRSGETGVAEGTRASTLGVAPVALLSGAIERAAVA